MRSFRLLISLLNLLLIFASYSATSTSCSPPCPIEEKNTCYPHHKSTVVKDIAKFGNISTAIECCQLCQWNPQCAAFTMNFDGKPHVSTVESGPSCILKTGIEIRVKGNCTSGTSGRPMPPTPSPPTPSPDYCLTHKCHNVLFFLSDDMRADIGAYGLPVHTPNLDALAKKSLVFERAYCQLSVCAPSRMSFMTSRRPDTNGVWNFIDTNPLNTSATPGHFRDFNYITLGLGKTFHQNGGSWNEHAYWSDDLPYYHYGVGKCPHGGQGGGHCVQNDTEIYDYHLRLKTIEYLQYAINVTKTTGRPFFVMSGFRKPHAPWQAPQRMYDLYNESAISIAKHKVLPLNAPMIAWSNQLAVKLENGTGFPYDPEHAVPDWVQKDQRHAYYASVSYVDEHIGIILKTLEKSGLANDTIVVFHADHGYHLGEHGEWEKKSNWDLVVRVPLIIHAPWKSASIGHKTKSLTDLVDVFPTIAVLAGLPKPDGVDGDDVSALFDNPNKIMKKAAFHQYPACGCDKSDKVCFNTTRGGCNGVKRTDFNHMGYSIRTDNWRYTAWFHWNKAALASNWDGPFAEELYDHTGDDSTDMDKFENENLAKKNPEQAMQLHKQLRDFFESHQTHPYQEYVHLHELGDPDMSDPFDLD